MFPELKLHMQRVRLLFFVMGIEKLSFEDLKLPPAPPSGPVRQLALRSRVVCW